MRFSTKKVAMMQTYACFNIYFIAFLLREFNFIMFECYWINAPEELCRKILVKYLAIGKIFAEKFCHKTEVMFVDLLLKPHKLQTYTNTTKIFLSKYSTQTGHKVNFFPNFFERFTRNG